MAKTMYQDKSMQVREHLPDAAHLSLNTLPLDGLPTGASSHSDPGLACNIAAFCPLPSIGHRDTLLVETRPSPQLLDLDRSTPQGLNLGFQRERVYRPERGKELPEALRSQSTKVQGDGDLGTPISASWRGCRRCVACPATWCSGFWSKLLTRT